MMSITLNGQSKQIAEGTSAAGLVAELGIGARKFAVEINREVVSKERLGEAMLHDGDEVNVVTLVGGG
jgi:thiamine biosynthesis protein ThiS